jgi:hypothetical protein
MRKGSSETNRPKSREARDLLLMTIVFVLLSLIQQVT